MANESVVNVTIKVDAEKGITSVKQFGAEAEKSFAHTKQAINETGSGAEKATQGIGQAAAGMSLMGSAASRLVPILAGAFAADKLVRFGNEALAAASRLEETNNKFNVVFKGMTTQANAWAAELSDDYLMSEEAGKGYMASMQDLLKPMGMNSQAAGKLSADVVKLAADMGSFNNIPTADVLADIRSALVGEYEPMRKYGSILSATSVEQKALALGLVKTKEEITPLSRAQAALTMIMASNKDAIGDVARSSDSYANTQKGMKAATEDLLAAVGDKGLKQAFTGLAGAIADAERAFTRWLRNSDTDKFTSLTIEIERMEKQLAANKASPYNLVGSIDIQEKQLENKKKQLAALQAIQNVDIGADALIRRRQEEKADSSASAESLAAAAKAREDALKKSLDAYKQIAGGIQVVDEQTYQIKKDLINGEYAERMKSLSALGIGSTKYAQAMVALEQWRVGEVKKINEQLSGTQTKYSSWAATQRWDVQGLKDAETVQAGTTLDAWSEMVNERKRMDRELDDSLEQSSTYMIALSQRTADSMENNFSNLYFDVMTGRFTNLRDVGEACLDSLARATADVLGQMTRAALFGDQASGEAGFFDSLFASAKGNVFENGSVQAFAKGTVLTRPVIFPMAKGYGLAGEAGPEGILPLGRTRSGELGVKTTGGSGQTVIHNHNYYISTVDAAGVNSFVRRNSSLFAGAVMSELGDGNKDLANAIRRA